MGTQLMTSFSDGTDLDNGLSEDERKEVEDVLSNTLLLIRAEKHHDINRDASDKCDGTLKKFKLSEYLVEGFKKTLRYNFSPDVLRAKLKIALRVLGVSSGSQSFATEVIESVISNVLEQKQSETECFNTRLYRAGEDVLLKVNDGRGPYFAMFIDVISNPYNVQYVGEIPLNREEYEQDLFAHLREKYPEYYGGDEYGKESVAGLPDTGI